MIDPTQTPLNGTNGHTNGTNGHSPNGGVPKQPRIPITAPRTDYTITSRSSDPVVKAASAWAAWDQQIGAPYFENIEQYRRFLCYLHLGFGRTLLDAYRLWIQRGMVDNKRPGGLNDAFIDAEKYHHCPPSWLRESKQFKWKERAQTYDSWVLTTKGRKAVSNGVDMLESASKSGHNLARMMEEVTADIATNWKTFKIRTPEDFERFTEQFERVTNCYERIVNLMPRESMAMIGQDSPHEVMPGMDGGTLPDEVDRPVGPPPFVNGNGHHVNGNGHATNGHTNGNHNGTANGNGHANGVHANGNGKHEPPGEPDAEPEQAKSFIDSLLSDVQAEALIDPKPPEASQN